MGEKPSIPEFFSGQNVFITGGTGFMGKVLIEKLLRSCPHLGNVYVLIRCKKGKSAQERIKDMVNLPLFKVLKKENPEAIKKIIPVIGDVTQLGLGLSKEDRQLLIDNVNIVYHAAASIRFDDHLSDAIIMNTRSTREVALIIREMKHIVVFVHFSTTYCHTDKKEIGEVMYPAHADWRDAIRMAENLDKYEVDLLTKKYIDPLPNTYTFTKSLSEHVVQDLCEGVVPTVIYRPSIVISTWDDPIPGWMDNFNGPVGLLIAVGKGVLKSIYADTNLRADFIPVDIITKGIIIGTWKNAITKNNTEKKELVIYNCSQNDVSPITTKEIMTIGHELVLEYPMSQMLWFPETQITKCWYMHYIRVIFYHLLPALIVDGLLKLAGKKPILIRVQRKIYTANMALSYFINNQWSFLNNNSKSLLDELLLSDKEAFFCDFNEIEPYEYFRRGIIGGREYLMKESSDTLPAARRLVWRLWILSRLLNGIVHILVLYYLYCKIPFRQIYRTITENLLYDYFASL